MRYWAMLLALAVSFTAGAAGKMKAGLWEMSMKSDAMQGMQDIPPEQMEKMKKMGLNVPMVKNGAITHRVCITQEMVDHENIPGMDQARQQQECKMVSHNQSGDSYQVKLHCDGPNI